jgi:6-phosphogluconolactonase/glucosamine-6-phosphate isomerase/deaminase
MSSIEVTVLEPPTNPVFPVKPAVYSAPETRYFRLISDFNEACGRDFIQQANNATEKGAEFLTGLSHGQSPAGVYAYILEHHEEIKRWDLIRFTFTNSRLQSQRDLEDVMDARAFLVQLLRNWRITKDQVFGRGLDRDKIEEYAENYNEELAAYLESQNKDGFDYVFLASDPYGRVAGITRNSTSFNSADIMAVVQEKGEKQLTLTPHFLMRSKRIAFLATKADKRRALAWLYSPWGKPDESPSFLRFINRVKERMTVFVDDKALTWPQIQLKRKTSHGTSVIRIDMTYPYRPDAKKKLPVVLLIHGFLGLNSFDGLLMAIPSHKYIAAAMHYGSIPKNLTFDLYSKHIVNNINYVVNYFGSNGHPVYIFDHSMGNIYLSMIDRDFEKLSGVKKYLRGRIGANPFFGQEAQHALIGFLDSVIIPSLSFREYPGQKAIFMAARRIVPFDTKKGVRRRGIRLSDWLIRENSEERDRIWQAVKERILYLMSNMDSLPDLNRIPIEHALSRIPAKVFAIQIYSALLESKAFDGITGLMNLEKYGIPVMILKSEKDAVARFVPKMYQNEGTTVVDVTRPHEKDLFREHLYHMIDPQETMRFIDEFVTRTEAKWEEVLKA